MAKIVRRDLCRYMTKVSLSHVHLWFHTWFLQDWMECLQRVAILPFSYQDLVRLVGCWGRGWGARCEGGSPQYIPSPKGEGGNRGWDGWMASLTQRTWVWASSRRWWRMGKPGILHFMGSQSQTRLWDWTANLLLREKLTENLAFFWIKSTASTYIPRISLRLVSGSCLQKGWLNLF